MGYLLTQGATVLCLHGGQAQPTTTSSHVKINGQPVITQTSSYSISACSFMQGSKPSPCITAQWTSGATRVKADGAPVLLDNSQATCTPNGTGVNIVMTQTGVKGQ
jgi:uncharacterized Zn-binding protein involved in type VI secretion